MSKIQVIIKPRQDIFEALSDEMRKTPGIVKTAIKRQGTRFKRRTLARLREYPGVPTYPLRWQSERQRRAFFATGGFDSGIPYQRTGTLADSWRFQADYRKDISMRVFNAAEYASFVMGDDQQNMHIDTGWNYAPLILVEEEERFEDVLIDTYFLFADPTAGVF